MKINIGKTPDWVGPYQIAEKVLFWMPRDDDRVFNLGDILAGKGEDTLLYKFCEWIYQKRSQTIEIKVESEDIWAVDRTLSLITVEVLKKLMVALNKPDSVYGYPAKLEYDKDLMPEGLAELPLEDLWLWVVGEMLWAHTQVIDDTWEENFSSGIIKMEEKSFTDEKGITHKVHTPASDSTYKLDVEGWKAYDNKVEKGLLLFAKYYRSLGL